MGASAGRGSGRSPRGPCRACAISISACSTRSTRSGALTPAAQQLHLSQPAISHTLRQLRDIFSDPLLVRTSAGMTPTPKASALAEKIRHIEAFLQQAGGSLRTSAWVHRGSL
ncbi:helix-turn-helix domain-containing protein [Salipiger abyssi]|uniref:LysR family transcriptional regulator n=1 Tax=Salipiger abyssi TaxID=1250539 RepID=UPI001A8EDCED|nr:LysR family transcriptional regulator [Salipiger abyssi]